MSIGSGGAPMRPPVAARRHTERTVHGHMLVDDYAWLREKENPEVLAYLEAENAWCQHVMAGTEDLQKQLYDEMRSHIKETDVSVPFRDREYWYYQRTEEGKQYEIYCRKRGTPEGPTGEEEILLDVNRAGGRTKPSWRWGRWWSPTMGICWRIRATTRGSGNTSCT